MSTALLYPRESAYLTFWHAFDIPKVVNADKEEAAYSNAQGGMVVWRTRGREGGLPWDRRNWEICE